MPHHRRGIERLLEENSEREIEDEKKVEVEWLFVLLSLSCSACKKGVSLLAFKFFPNCKVESVLSNFCSPSVLSWDATGYKKVVFDKSIPAPTQIS